MTQFHACHDAYIHHLLADHRRLHKLLLAARCAIAPASEERPTKADVLATLRNVRAEIARHFDQEEAGGCLEEAACFCPAISGDVQRLEREHPEMLAELDRLIAAAQDRDEGDTASQCSIERQFVELCRNLHAHEAAENELIRRAFGINVNGDEDDAQALSDG